MKKLVRYFEGPEAGSRPRAGLFLSILTYVFRCCSVLERWGVILDGLVKFESSEVAPNVEIPVAVQ